MSNLSKKRQLEMYQKINNLPDDPGDESNILAAVAAVKAETAGIAAVSTAVVTNIPLTITALQSAIDAGFALTGNALVTDVLDTKTFYKDNYQTKLTGAMPNHVADVEASAISNDGTKLEFTVPAGYYPGTVKVYYESADFTAANILSTATIFGVAGSHV